MRFWLRRARVKILQDQIRSLEIFRIAQHADKAHFDEAIAELKRKEENLRAGKTEEAIIVDSWDELALIKGM